MPLTKIKRSIIFITLLLSNYFYAQQSNDKLLETILNQLKLSEDEIITDLIVSKKLPYISNQTIFVIPKYIEKEKTDNDVYTCKLQIVTIDNLQGKIVWKYSDDEILNTNTKQISEIEINEKPLQVHHKYNTLQLSVTQRIYSTTSIDDTISTHLYLIKGKLLKKIFSADIYNRFGEYSQENCYLQTETMQNNITADTLQKTNKHNDLLMQTRIRKEVSLPDPNKEGECHSQQTLKEQKTIRIKFNGNTYN